MSQDKFIRALRHVQTTREFVNLCAQIIEHSPLVKIDEKALNNYADSLRKPAFLPDWHDYLSDRIINRNSENYIKDQQERMRAAMFELAQNCAINGGYIYRGADGKIKKWARDGSGAAALQQSLKTLWAHAAVPGVTKHDPVSARAAMEPLWQDIPEQAFRNERLGLLAAFAEAQAQNFLNYGYGLARRNTKRFHFDYRTTMIMGESNVLAFHEDPFRKKLLLLPVLFASYAASEGEDVQLDLPIPADYRVPQTLHNMGVLRLNAALARTIEAGQLFSADDPAVTSLRAASVVAADKILQRVRARLTAEHPGFRFELNHLDADLWQAGRLFDKKPAALDAEKQQRRATLESFGKASNFHDPAFKGRAAKPINVHTLRF